MDTDDLDDTTGLPPQLQPTKPTRGMSAGKLVLLVVGALGLFLLASVGYALLTTEFEVTPAQRAALHSIADLEPWYDFDVDPAHETLVGERHLDGTWNATYTYEPPDDGLPYLHSMLACEGSSLGAKALFATTWQAMRLGVSLLGEGATLEEAADVCSWGEEARFAYVRHGERRVGMMLCGREGRHIYVLSLVTGSDCAAELGDLQAFFAPKLAAVRTGDLRPH
jgi:hypothetical protein